MKFLILAAAIVGAVVAHPVSTGSSNVQRTDDGLGNYAFGYNEDHATGGSFRKEKGGPGYMTGSYGLRDADGRMRIVTYVADAHGYRTSISTNEPGTDVKQDPAAANFNLGDAVLAAPAPVAMVAGPIASSYAMTTQHLSAPMIAHAGYGLNKLF